MARRKGGNPWAVVVHTTDAETFGFGPFQQFDKARTVSEELDEAMNPDGDHNIMVVPLEPWSAAKRKELAELYGEDDDDEG